MSEMQKGSKDFLTTQAFIPIGNALEIKLCKIPMIRDTE
ncbi:hypothetical protein OUM_0245 [Helicobacter pylori R038b]|uniref:Uncharacterized protein n=1 Tax=Helicobacter pylori R038b TaxID=1145115 RepID=K2KBJ3_HELPX|nr:hypothetical protein OUM_0245 [Helicobacter pylori R038b]